MRRISSRLIFLAIFLACAGLMGYGLYLQHVENLEPCPLCILQRYAFVGTGLIALAAALQGPGRMGARIYGVLTILAAGIGAGIAGRQSWLVHHPPQALDCGPGLEYMIESFPLSKVLPKVFQGEGDCAKVAWRFLGLSIPEWALVWFAILIVLAVWAMLAPARVRSGAPKGRTAPA
jgi:disulfide bond formation protein DsbB